MCLRVYRPKLHGSIDLYKQRQVVRMAVQEIIARNYMLYATTSTAMHHHHCHHHLRSPSRT